MEAHPKNSVMVVVGNELLREKIRALLERGNLMPLLACDAASGIEQLYREKPQLVIVDLPLAGMHGADLCRQMLGFRLRTPIIFLGAATDAVEAVLLLELGADDYVVKPFHERELQARIRAVLRRTACHRGPRIYFGEIEVDVDGRYIRRHGEEIRVTRAEYDLLLFFIRNAGRALTSDAILNEVWGYDFYPNTRIVDAHVVKLRSKLEPEPRVPRHFLTIHGVGYRFLMFPAAMRPVAMQAEAAGAAPAPDEASRGREASATLWRHSFH
jgi:DNA-binding response OmpR family regulator